MRRLQDWPARLNGYLSEVSHTPFSWGSHDCVLMALGAAGVQLGIDPAAAIRGHYSSEIGAARHMKRLYRSARLDEAAEVFAAQWGGISIRTSMAQRGDLVLYQQAGMPALGVCTGRKFCVAGLSGLVFFDMRTALAAWRV